MSSIMQRRMAALAVAFPLALGCAAFAPAMAAPAQVRFGNNVRVGGHDFSNRTYDRNNRAVIHLYDRTPRRAGCAWRPDGRGGRVQVCHLRRKPH